MNDIVRHSDAVKRDFGLALTLACKDFITYLDDKTGLKHKFVSEIIENESNKFLVSIEIGKVGIARIWKKNRTKIVLNAKLSLHRRPPLPKSKKKRGELYWRGILKFLSSTLKLPGNEIYHQLAYDYCSQFHQAVITATKNKFPITITVPSDPKLYKIKLAEKMLAILETESGKLLASIIASTGKIHLLVTRPSFVSPAGRISAGFSIKEEGHLLRG